MLYILAGTSVFLVVYLLRIVYQMGYSQGQIDQIRDDAKSFLQSVKRHEDNKRKGLT